VEIEEGCFDVHEILPLRALYDSMPDYTSRRAIYSLQISTLAVTTKASSVARSLNSSNVDLG